MKHTHHMTSVSALLGSAVSDSSGRTVGYVRELAVSPTIDAKYVRGFLLKMANADRDAKLSLVTVADVEPTRGRLRMRPETAPIEGADDDSYLLLDRDVLDQQIIDVHGHKVVRVNDVELVWEQVADSAGVDPGPECRPALRIAEVEVGMRGAMRRLLKGLPPTTVEKVASRFRTSVIPWDFVDLIDRDPARRVRLKIEQDRLAKMHPSDLADILEELAPAERQALFTSLDENVAAEALEEVEPRMQKALTESLDSERIAGIVEEMDPAAAADFLAELPDERSEAILEEMDPEERQEVQELLEFPENSAAGQMTTDYISLPDSAIVSDAVRALRHFEGDVEMQTHIFLVDEDEVFRAAVPLVKLLLSTELAELKNLADGYTVCCEVDASGKKVAELFDKYNLRALPVVDSHKKLAGVIYAEQVIEQLRAKY
ncbi:MAG: CBS domain-containing protein [Acidobacteriota bacterium]|nr:CBS domain-containing protein [Acidobacteriota bacterium]